MTPRAQLRGLLPSGCRALSLFLFAAALAACSPGPAAQPPAPSGQAAAPAVPSTSIGALPGPRPLRGEPEGGSPRRRDTRWQRALAGDPLDLRALAGAEGATGLLEGVEDGGDLFRAACEALPFADDAELSLGRLGEVALLDDAALSQTAVVAIHRIAAGPPSRGEPLDPDGVSSAARAVLALASNVALPRDRRARAVSAARAFAERGALDPATIPGDLDPDPQPSSTTGPGDAQARPSPETPSVSTMGLRDAQARPTPQTPTDSP